MKLLVGLAVTLFISGFAHAETLKLDTSKSTLKWVGKKVTGQHDGNVKIKSGSVTFGKNNNLSKGTFVLDMKSISNNDVESPKWRKKLVDHLKNEDFFNVEKFPTAKFVIKSSKKSKKVNTWDVTGALTVKNKTNEVTFPATITTKGNQKMAKASFKIDRSKWDIKYNSGSFFDPKKLGDKLIYDDIEIELNLVTEAKAGKKS